MDANILIRAVLGTRVRFLLAQYGGSVQFFAPESAFEEARQHLPAILLGRGIPSDDALAVLAAVSGIVHSLGVDAISAFEEPARLRLKGRDIDDWPVLAAALALDCPIWTEDTDFFGTGVAAWTSDRVELYLRSASDRA